MHRRGAPSALTGGLAVYAFVRGYGIPFLGMPRTRQAAARHRAGQPVAGPALLAVACVALAVGAPVVLLAWPGRCAPSPGSNPRAVLLPGNLSVIPAHTHFSAFSPDLPGGLPDRALAVVPLLIYLAGAACRAADACRCGTAGSSRSSRACSTPP